MSQFLLKRLHSLSGVLPLGAFLLQHFFGNAYVFVSPEAFNEHSHFLTSLPLVELIEISTIYMPIAFHAGVGFYFIYKGQNNFTSYSLHRNWMFFLQRLTGLLAFVFIATHAYTTRIQSWLAGVPFTYDDMARILTQPLWFWFYVVGVVSVVFHFWNGLWSFLITWGVTIGPKAQRVTSSISMVGFALMSLLGISFLIKFAGY